MLFSQPQELLTFVCPCSIDIQLVVNSGYLVLFFTSSAATQAAGVESMTLRDPTRQLI